MDAKIRLIDTHAHLNSYSDVEGIIDEAKGAGVHKIVVVSFDLRCARVNDGIVSKNDNLFAAVGVHPNSACDFDKQAQEEIKLLAKNEKVKAIGESGLDYYRQYCSREEQVKAFKWHMDLANALDLPLIIHSREAMDDTIEVLVEQGAPKAGFVLHAFSGDEKQAQQIFDLGGLISVTGVVTFKNAPQLQKVVANADIGKIMIETDSPYLTPEPFRGKKNKPANVFYVAKKIAEIKELSIEEVAGITTKTAEAFFGI